MLKFAICDDSNSARNKTIEMLYRILEKNNYNGDVVFSTDNRNSFLDYITKNPCDVAILDVDLKSDINGLELAKKIREINTSLKIIFLTAHLEYMMLSFKVHTFDYLVKPITLEKLEECIFRLTQFTYIDDDSYIKIRSGPVTHMINKHEIIYIEKDNAKINIYTNNEIIETYSTLEDFLNTLPSYFVRCHKSYIVNIKKIIQVNTITNEVLLANSYKCFVGRKFKSDLMNILK